MQNFGKRLKEERERLGMSQEKFGKACGVGKTTQYLYERGERHPASLYIDAAAKLGVDTSYVMTATRKGRDWSYNRAYSRMLMTFETLLGLKKERLEVIAAKYVHLSELPENNSNQETPHEWPAFEDWMLEFGNWLSSASNLEYCVDITLMSRLIDAITMQAERTDISLTTEKRLRVALMLYRDAKFSGEIDPRSVKNAIKIAS